MKTPACTTDWVSLWNTLVKQREAARRDEPLPDAGDRWSARAAVYDARTRDRWAAKDTSREFLCSLMKSLGRPTLLDIGAGSGKWAVPLAPLAASVTALEPSSAMRARLEENIARHNLRNITIVPRAWPCDGLTVHDITLCSHAMYGFDDFAAFVQGVQAITRHTCVWLMRAPPLDGIMADAARHLFGHPYDSVNFHIAFNALLQLGIFPNVLMEDPRTWDPWVHDSVEDALAEMKRKLRLYDDTTHDAFLKDLLDRRLIRKDGRFVWPCGTHAALVYWQVPAKENAHD